MSKRGMARAAARRRATGVATAAAFAVAAPAASAIEVNSLADPGNNNCNDGTCTLREAMDLADSTPATNDSITFRSGLSGTIVLNGTAGQLTAYTPMTIQGPGPGVVTVSGDTDSNGSPDVRTLYGATDGLSISGLTFTKGAGKADNATGPSSGGAMYFFKSSVVLYDVVISASKIPTSSGGGIFAGSTDLTVTNSTIVGNDAAARGGGLAVEEVPASHSNSLTISDSTIAGNDADYGGGVNASSLDSTRIERSTISGNTAGTYGGGGNSGLGAVVIVDSTVAGNKNPGGGGGGWSFGSGSVGSVVSNSTIAGNTASYAGGAVATSAATGAVTISSSILADNADNDLMVLGNTPSFTATNSLVETPGASSFVQVPGATNVIGADPQLGPLAANAGLTQTMEPALTSPAIDAGVANGLTLDQRGLPRTLDQKGPNAAGSDGTDIGAVERTDQTDPDLAAKIKGKTKAGKPIKVTISSDEAGIVNAGAKAKAGKKKVKFKTASAKVAAGDTVTLKLKLAKRPAKILKRIGRGKATVNIAAEDFAGNTADQKLKVKLK